eukprot:1195613-Prorocentrum_minimum.AAC.1
MDVYHQVRPRPANSPESARIARLLQLTVNIRGLSAVRGVGVEGAERVKSVIRDVVTLVEVMLTST